jgi:hypothetical protein
VFYAGVKLGVLYEDYRLRRVQVSTVLIQAFGPKKEKVAAG